MDQALISLYHRHVAVAFDRQTRFADFLERESVSSEPYRYTTSTATLEFGNTVKLEALDLGSHADPDNSWLWVWCNPNMKLTSANRKLAENVRMLGQTSGVDAFKADRQFSSGELLGPDLSPVTAHAMASIMVGEFGFDAYYTMPFKHGRFAVVIRDERLQSPLPNPIARILAIFPQVLASFPVLDHRAAFIAYTQSYGLSVEEKPRSVRAFLGGKDVMKATFDHTNRMTELTGTIAPTGDS
jgi:hypothetical protein